MLLPLIYITKGDEQKVYQVIKRNGKRAVYNINKIKNAVYKAAKATGLDNAEANELAYNTSESIDVGLKQVWLKIDDINVETIQNMVEKALMDLNKEVSKAYIIYRYQHEKIRNNERINQEAMNMIDTVSYTHLTLPTILLV